MAFTHEKLVVWQESVIFVRWASEHLIPKEVAFVRHLTWLHGGGEKKVAYQKKRFGDCSFRFNTERGELEFDPEYFEKYKEAIPQLFKD